MQIRLVTIENFRGVRSGSVHLAGNSLLVGGNGVGKSTVCEALDLVLGPERLFRRPVVDEYDFYGADYRPREDGTLPTIRIEVVLTDLGEAAQRRFHTHLRRWDTDAATYVPADPDGGSLEAGEWCLPLLFLGRYNPAEDDFDTGTYFAYPRIDVDDLSTDIANLGAGQRNFTRDDKRFCSFLYLRAVRTGNRALSFGRGSLIDTIVRLQSDNTSALMNTAIEDLDAVTLAETNAGLNHLRTQLHERIEQFLPLATTGTPIDVKASDLTREHVREVMRIFLASQPGTHMVPFNRLSTGSVNVLVFALLTYIAEIAGQNNVIFAMEEPEIALPPHTQRRLVDFATRHMGQTIITSHSPYVIERFEPDQVVALRRQDDGELESRPVELPTGFKLKRYRDNRRQFAEAVLARGVLVVEGATEAIVMAMASDVLEADPGINYEHLDNAGVSIFDAGGDTSVPMYAPLFAGMRKSIFGFHDKPTNPLTADQQQQATSFDVYQQSSYTGIEDLLANEAPLDVIERFLAVVATRSDNPQPGFNVSAMDEAAKRALACALLIKRKGSADGYAPLLLAECLTATDLPHTILTFLTEIDQHMRPTAPPPTVPPSTTAGP